MKSLDVAYSAMQLRDRGESLSLTSAATHNASDAREDAEFTSSGSKLQSDTMYKHAGEEKECKQVGKDQNDQ